jgi:hypothetical protein
MLQLPCYRWTGDCNVMLQLPCFHWSEDCNVMLQLPCFHWSHSPHKSNDCAMANGQTDTLSSDSRASPHIAASQWHTPDGGKVPHNLPGHLHENCTHCSAVTSHIVLRAPHMPSLHTKGHVYCRHPPSFRKSTCELSYFVMLYQLGKARIRTRPSSVNHTWGILPLCR